MRSTPKYAGWIDFDIDVEKRSVEALLMRLDTALSPPAIAQLLGGPVQEYVKRRAAQRFANEGDDVVGAWAPLQPATQAIRAQEGYGADGPINRRTDELMNYIVGSPGRTVMHSLGATLTYPGNPPTGETKAKVQTAQIGKPYPQTPPRPVLGLGEQDLIEILTILSVYVGGAIRGI
jgi:hypothetical protein